MSEILSYLFWGLGRGYVGETNLALAVCASEDPCTCGAGSLPSLRSVLGGWWCTYCLLSLSWAAGPVPHLQL